MKLPHPTLSSVISSLAVILAAATPAWSQDAPDAPAAEQENDPLNAVVKLEVSKTYPNIYRPWVNITDSATGSGVVIEDGLILTCAHCVADATMIRIRSYFLSPDFRSVSASSAHFSAFYISGDIILAREPISL